LSLSFAIEASQSGYFCYRVLGSADADFLRSWHWPQGGALWAGKRPIGNTVRIAQAVVMQLRIRRNHRCASIRATRSASGILPQDAFNSYHR
jgi:hypothetical protein